MRWVGCINPSSISDFFDEYGAQKLTSSLNFNGRVQTGFEEVYTRRGRESDANIASTKRNDKNCRSTRGRVLKIPYRLISFTRTTRSDELINLKFTLEATDACLVNIDELCENDCSDRGVGPYLLR
jgi:hypothetical protein